MTKKLTKSPTGRRPVTSLDVAKAVGVSRATVGFVLNNTPGQTISAATRQRVWEAVRRLDYRPNVSARALRKGHGDEIYVFIHDHMFSYATVAWITGAQEQARQLGYMLATYIHADVTLEPWETMLAELFARRPAGIVGTVMDVSEADWKLAQHLGVRGCALVAPEGPVSYAPMIPWPHEEAGYAAGAYLGERGHQLVGYVVPRTPKSWQLGALRRNLRGLRSALEPRGGTLTEVPMDATAEDARAAVEQILRRPKRPTAIYSYKDKFCFPLLRALNDRGLCVPQDLAVLGTDDTPSCTIVKPALTSVRLHLQTLGARLVTVVDCQVRGKTPSPELFILPTPTVIVRESTEA
jgi:DNA-binding LacI/PurR family transcriptional regulator